MPTEEQFNQLAKKVDTIERILDELFQCMSLSIRITPGNYLAEWPNFKVDYHPIKEDD